MRVSVGSYGHMTSWWGLNGNVFQGGYVHTEMNAQKGKWSRPECRHWPAWVRREERVCQSEVLGSRCGWDLPNIVPRAAQDLLGWPSGEVDMLFLVSPDARCSG